MIFFSDIPCGKDIAAGSLSILDPRIATEQKIKAAGWEFQCTGQYGFEIANTGNDINADDNSAGFSCGGSEPMTMSYTFECGGTLNIVFRNNHVRHEVILRYDGTIVQSLSTGTDGTQKLVVEAGKVLSLQETGSTRILVKSWEFVPGKKFDQIL